MSTGDWTELVLVVWAALNALTSLLLYFVARRLITKMRQWQEVEVEEEQQP